MVVNNIAIDFIISDLTEAEDISNILLETQIFKSINSEDVFYFIDKNAYNFPLNSFLKNY